MTGLPTWSSAIPAPFTLVMYLAKPILESFSLFPGARVGQATAKVVFCVPKALAVLPIVAPLLPALRANSGDPGDRNLNVGLPWGVGLEHRLAPEGMRM